MITLVLDQKPPSKGETTTVMCKVCIYGLIYSCLFTFSHVNLCIVN